MAFVVGKVGGGKLRIAIVLAGASMAAVSLLLLLAPRLAAPPNLLLITIDTLRADHLGCYGYARDTSPSIDRLARDGTLFEQARVQWPKTNASVASLLTSTYGATNGVRAAAASLDRRLTTLAEMLAEEGYYSAAFVANAHLGKAFRFDQGFAEVHELWGNRWVVHNSTINSAPFANDRIAREVKSWLAQNGGRRFFLWVHFLDPHGPYQPPAGFDGRFGQDELYRAQQTPVAEELIPWWIKDEKSTTLGDYVANYDREIASTDAAVGEILEEVKRLGLERKSLVVLTADHGESLGEHRYFFQHGKFLYDDCLRVPLIMRLPGKIPAGRRVSAHVGLIDLLPTILDLLGSDRARYRTQLEGESFFELFRRKGTGEIAQRPIFSEAQRGQVSVVLGEWKLIHEPATERYRLFDLGLDPGETQDVSERHPSVVAKLQGMMESWRAERKRNRSYLSKRVPAAEMEPAVRQQLENLGYLEPR